MQWLIYFLFNIYLKKNLCFIIARSVYQQIRENVMDECIFPHLVIYLDISVDEVKKRLAKRALPHEKNSPALTDQFLSSIEYEYKSKYLKSMT